MHSKTIFTFLAFVAATSAAAVPEENLVKKDGGISARACPDGYDTCGECNGTSCKIGGINYICGIGKCTVQSGGGDGKICGRMNGDDGKVTCPGTG